MPAATSTGTVREIWPLLFVDDIARSLEFYRDRLGFEVVAEARDGDRLYWCRLRRDAASLMLQQTEAEDGDLSHRGRGVVLYFLCDDADAMHAELTTRGMKLSAPQTAEYGMRQVEIVDPDGYDLCFESVVEPQ